jgi:hypothetical protein
VSPEHERQRTVAYLRGLARTYYRRADHDVARAFRAAADAIGRGEHHEGELAPAPQAVAAAIERAVAEPPPVVARPTRGVPSGDACQRCGQLMRRDGKCLICPGGCTNNDAGTCA